MTSSKRAVKELQELQAELSDNDYQYGWISSRIDDILYYMNNTDEDQEDE